MTGSRTGPRRSDLKFPAIAALRKRTLGGGSTLQDPNFGLWRTQLNTPRRMQLALKLYWYVP